MSITKKLALRHLKQNKTRSVLTVLGITISVVMLTVIFTCATSFAHYYGERAINTNGNWHFFVKTDYESAKKYLLSDSSLKDIGFEKDLSTEEQSYKIYSDKANYLRTGTIYQGDAQYIKDTVTCKYDGALPKSDNEIMVEQSLIKNNGLELKIGDEIKIAVGSRLKGDFVILPVKGNYQFGERFEKEKDETFKVVGILHNNEPTERGAIIRGMSDLKSKNLVAYGKIKKITPFSYIKINGIYDKFGFTKKKRAFNVGENTGFLNSRLAFSIDKNNLPQVLKLTAIGIVVFAVIFVSSFAMIYNSFALSVGEQIKYLGMLSSVGATKAQKRKSVYFEGAILGAVGIPVGIAAGILGIGITLKLIGNKIISTGMIAGVSESNMQMKVAVPFWAIIGVVIVSILTIFISSFIPARKASKITPIDAIRQRQEIKVKPKKLKSPKYIRKIFGYEGELAYKNLKRNGRKSRLITVSIALSIVLFISCNYFCNMFVQASGYEKTIPYQISTTITYAHKKELYDALDKMQGVNKYYIDTADMSIFLGKSSPIIKDNEIKDLENYTSAYSKLFGGEKDVATVIHYVDDSEFNTLCENNGIDYNAFYGDSLKCVLLNNLTHKQDTTKVFTDSIIGKHIIQNSDYANDEKNPLDIEVSGLVKFDKNSLPCNLVAPGVVGIIMPYSQYVNVVNKGEKASNISMSVCIETDDHKNVAKNLNNILTEKDYGGTFVSDNVDTLQTMNTVIFIVQVFVYGFISLISLITIANIINTISTNISLRRKEFAMLKSVGTAPSGFRKMVSLESVFYALKAVIFGVPISVLVCVLLNKMLGESSIPYQFDYKLYLGVILVVFAIIAVTMIYSVRKLKDDNIIETLKEDIS